MQVHGDRACCLAERTQPASWRRLIRLCAGSRLLFGLQGSMILWLRTTAGHGFGKATVTYWNYRNGVSDCRGRRQQSTKAQLSYHSRSRASLRWSSLSCGKHLVLRSALSNVTPVLTMAGVDLNASTIKDL